MYPAITPPAGCGGCAMVIVRDVPVLSRKAGTSRYSKNGSAFYQNRSGPLLGQLAGRTALNRQSGAAPESSNKAAAGQEKASAARAATTHTRAV